MSRWRFALLAGVLVPVAMAAAGLAVARWGAGQDLAAALLAPQPWPRVLAWAAGGAAASLGTTAALTALWPRLEEQLAGTGLRPAEEALRAAGWPLLAAVVAMAAWGEEVLFRGGLQPVLGLWPAAVLFGLAHGGWHLASHWGLVLVATLAGTLFGWVYVQAGSLWAPILAHMAHNVAVTLYLLWRRECEEEAGGDPPADGLACDPGAGSPCDPVADAPACDPAAAGEGAAAGGETGPCGPDP